MLQVSRDISRRRSLRSHIKAEEEGEVLPPDLALGYPPNSAPSFLQVVPVQGCRGCRRFQRQGLHIYLRLHMEQHRQELGQGLSRRLATTSVTKWKVKGGRLQLPPKEVQEKEEVVQEEDNSCTECGMAFETEGVLETHMEEIHEGRKNKFSSGFMILA